MSILLVLVSAMLAPASTNAEVLQRIEKGQIQLVADVRSIKEDVSDLKDKQRRSDDIYRDHHIPTRDQWSAVATKAEVTALAARVAQIERRMDYLLGALVVVLGLLGWVSNSTRVQVKGLVDNS
jgi:hypothetical protein